VYVDAARREDPVVRIRAALAYVRVPAAVSHVTGLWVWGLSRGDAHSVHLVTGREGHRRAGPDLLVHPWRDFHVGPPHTVERGGVPVLGLDQCLVDSWPLLPLGPEQRAPLLDAVASRRTTVRQTLAAAPKLPGRAELSGLLRRLEAGCHSELELWGYEHVFTWPEFAAVLRQHPVPLRSGTVYLDIAFEDVKVAVELDGAAWHGSREQRERDVRRDTELAALGWLVLRVTHRRLHSEPEIVRAEVLAAIRRRRGQLEAP
jgi:very-short-patch-repair endonuclease